VDDDKHWYRRSNEECILWVPNVHLLKLFEFVGTYSLECEDDAV
jgi:hypothetical protein